MSPSLASEPLAQPPLVTSHHPSFPQSSIVTVYNEPGSSLVLINMTSEEDQGIYSCVASNGVGDPVIMETEIVLGTW